jgi:mannose-6-phosphate isomerase-like protein (cupin superfamily)
LRKEKIVTVDKVWGEEIHIVNNDKYCGKLLLLNRNAICSYHYHKTKQETFFCLEGYAMLTIEGKEYFLAPYTRPKTILPGEKHKFHGITECIILEISMPHSEDDVVRLTESIPACADAGIVAGSEQDRCRDSNKSQE